MVFDFLADALSIPLRVAKIPAEAIREIGVTLDPSDDAGIVTLSKTIADTYNIPFETAEKAVREALED